MRAHNADGQWSLWGDGSDTVDDGPMPLDAALQRAAELVELGERPEQQLDLFAPNGIVVGASWRRESAGGEHRSWQQLDLALEARARFARPWCDGDVRTLDDVLAQTWNAADVRASWRRVTWLGDEIVDPLTGEVLPLPRKLQQRRILEVAVLACEAGTGGAVLTRHEWAAELGCSPRSVYNYQRPLIARGLLRVKRLRVPARDGSGSWLDRNLVRIGPALERQAALGRYARRKRVTLPGSLTRAIAGRLVTQLDRRAARRQWDRIGATWRGQYGLAVSVRAGPPVQPPTNACGAAAAPCRAVARDGIALEGERPRDLAELARELAAALGFEAPSLPLG